MNVYILHHVHKLVDSVSVCNDLKFIGVYSSRRKATAAIRRLRARPGFADSLDGFQIDEYQIDMDHWTDGFVTALDGV